MSKTENLFSKEAVEKIRDIAGDVRTTMFCTDLGNKPFGTIPMTVQQIQDDGTIWFFSGKDSEHNADIEKDPATQLIWANQSNEEYLSLYGKSEVLYDRQKAEELWNKIVKVWFPEGPTDPNLSLIRFTPSEGFYWDTQHGKIVAFAQMMASVVTGQQKDDGVSGKLKP